MVIVKVPLRISLAGGGTDLPGFYQTAKEGGAVLSLTINKYIYITLKNCPPFFKHRHRIMYSEIEEVDYFEQIKHPIVKNILSKFPERRGEGVNLTVLSDLPAGTGLGSSSAFTVGLFQAAQRFLYHVDENPYSLADAACAIEIENLKEPIGKQDQYAAAFGGCNFFSFDRSGCSTYPIPLNQDQIDQFNNVFLMVATGGDRKASKILSGIEPQTHCHTLLKIRALAECSYLALKKSHWEELGNYIEEGWELKKKLSPSISTPQVEEIINQGKLAGAMSGKLLGAGGVGFVLLYCPDGAFELKTRLQKIIKNKMFVPKFEPRGSRVVYED